LIKAGAAAAGEGEMDAGTNSNNESRAQNLRHWQIHSYQEVFLGKLVRHTDESSLDSIPPHYSGFYAWFHSGIIFKSHTRKSVCLLICLQLIIR
jgi:hypothetical protein